MSFGRHHDDDRHMTLRDHVKELVTRLSLAFILLLVASSLVYVYRESIIPIVLEPAKVAFGEQKLMYLNPAGGFNFIFLISIYIGVAAVTPFIIQQLYAFIRPTLPKDAQRLSLKLLIGSGLLLTTGMLFGYMIAVPGALVFLKEFAGEYVTAALTADSYLNFLVAYTVGLGLLFQLPILLIIANYIKPFTPMGLMRGERWAIVLIFIAAAIITPTPDPVNLLIVALPILLIYQIGVVSVLVTNAQKSKKQRRHAKATEAVQSKITTSPAVVTPVVPLPTSVVTLTKQGHLTVKAVDGIKITNRPHTSRTNLAVTPRPVVVMATRRNVAATQTASSRRYLDGVSVVVSQ